jgi:hypothetical protein
MINSITGAGEARARRVWRKNSPIPGIGALKIAQKQPRFEACYDQFHLFSASSSSSFSLIGCMACTDLDDQLHCIAYIPSFDSITGAEGHFCIGVERDFFDSNWFVLQMAFTERGLGDKQDLIPQYHDIYDICIGDWVLERH